MALVTVLAVAGGCSGGNDEVGGPAPGFDLENVVEGGPRVELRALRGRPVVLNFWATWCAPCKREMPDLQAMHEELGNRVRFVGIDVQDSRRLAKRFLDEVGVTYPSGYDPNRTVFDRYGLQGMPQTVLVDARGRLVARHIGEIDADKLRELIAEHFPEVGA